MKFTPTSLPDILLIEPKIYGDQRGFFLETYRAEDFAAVGISALFVQDNHSGSGKGTLRGLHYQIRQAQSKLVYAIVGEIYDVAVDIRRSSPTFGQWFGLTLSAQDKCQLYIPTGFAHGFYVLSDWAEVIYKATDYYAPQWERTLLWNDPDLDIHWPLLSADGTDVPQPPILSMKDTHGTPFRQAECYD